MSIFLSIQKSSKFLVLLALACTLVGADLAQAGDAPRFKPGFNLFSPQKDVEIGKESVVQVEKEVPLLKDAQTESYVSQLGRRLVDFAPGNTDYPWTFKVVNSQDINAFALPGGFIYVNRGVLEAAEDEAQVAGVIAHEIGHVVMRHGTHRASQAMLAQMPLAILGGVLGQSGSATAQLAQMGIGLGMGSLMLKNSRGAESQADDFGTYMLYEAGYDPHAMAQFFDIVGNKYPQQTVQFFSDHPNPENRVKRVDALIPQLGPAKQGRRDNPEFQAVKKRSLGLPAPPNGKPAAGGQPAPKAPSAPEPPPPPSSHFVKYRGDGYAIGHPDNWQVYSGKERVALAPDRGVFNDANGAGAQAYGAVITRLIPPARRGYTVGNATQDFVAAMQQSNPAMRVLQQTRGKVRGRKALSTRIENDSPLQGQKEADLLVVVEGRNSFLALLFIAPQSAFGSYQSVFQAMLRSVEFQ